MGSRRAYGAALGELALAECTCTIEITTARTASISPIPLCTWCLGQKARWTEVGLYRSRANLARYDPLYSLAKSSNLS